MPRNKVPYPERICPVCETVFVPQHKNQIYDKPYCRVKSNRKLHTDVEKGIEGAPIELSFMLETIRKVDPENARNLEQLAVKAGKKLAEEMIFIGYQLLERGGYRHARRMGIEDGLSVSKKSRSRKIK